MLTMATIDEKDVLHVAKLAKLEFAEDEIHQFTKQMGDIIEMVEQLNSVNTQDVPVTTHGYGQVNIMREDVAEQGTDRDLLMRNVKTEDDGFIQVPAIMSADGGGDA